jgi:hypothetical protein
MSRDPFRNLKHVFIYYEKVDCRSTSIAYAHTPRI